MDFYKKVLDILVTKTQMNPAVIHIDMTGLMHFGLNNKTNIKDLINSKLNTFNILMNDVKENGGQILIPSFSYSFSSQSTNNEYSIANSLSSVGQVNEFIRKSNTDKRTVDPMLSYIAFSKNKKFHHFDSQDYESFGESSLMHELFSHHGYICAIGPVLRRMTEAHYVEKKLSVEYRKNFTFQGITDNKGIKTPQKIIFFGRELDTPYEADFSRLEKHLKEKKLVETWEIDKFKIEAIKTDILEEEMFNLYKKDKTFFICDLETKKQKNRGNLT